jgi:hypothetical protein
MTRHWKGLTALAIATLLSIGIGMMISPYLGYAAFGLSFTVWLVVTVAWMRTPGFEEHDRPEAGPSRPEAPE